MGLRRRDWEAGKEEVVVVKFAESLRRERDWFTKSASMEVWKKKLEVKGLLGL